MNPGRKTSAPLTGRFSPLRYPGGKGKLARFVAEVVRANGLEDGLYVEPYAGGAAVAWELLLTGRVRRVHVNDLSRPIYAFWRSVLERTDDLARLVADTPLDLETWARMKRTFSNPDESDDLALGFAMFYLNRTNRSGILNGGPIGGRAQSSAWNMDARYNRLELVSRIERIAQARRRITLTNMDAKDLLQKHKMTWTSKTLVYLDPPYFDKGPDLYYNFYKHGDHAGVACAVRTLHGVPWIVSYDDVGPIHALYEHESWLQYQIGYSARNRTKGREAMFFSAGLHIPPVKGSMIEIARWAQGDEYLAPTLASESV
jgi:DNA adenine methylase